MNFAFSRLNGGDTQQTYLRNELLDIMVKLDRFYCNWSAHFLCMKVLKKTSSCYSIYWFDQIKIWLFKRPPGFNSHKTFVNEFVLVLKKTAN